MGYALTIVVGILLGVAFARLRSSRIVRMLWRKAMDEETPVHELIENHFRPTQLRDVSIAERRFPFRVRADLQRAIDREFDLQIRLHHFCGVKQEYSHDTITLSDCIAPGFDNAPVSVPPEYEEVNIGEEQPVRCLKNGLWLLESENIQFTVLLAASDGRMGRPSGMQFQIATVNNPQGTGISQEFFRHLENAVREAASYRGKILSLEQSEFPFSGESSGIKVHKLRTVEREQVILPADTLDLLDRNVIKFVQQRPQLARLELATKKGILFYGPPGTGKTHTIHYLAKALEGHTTLLITAEQVGLLAEYMTLARLLQPSVVIIEDVDLIARERTEMGSCEEVMLNKLLNEMDGLKEEADILFILTTNRPESLERALASRPGRIDQAIEFPLPDAEGRAKLINLYSQGLDLPDGLVGEIVKRTEKVSAAFIKELMRRSAQFHLERDGNNQLDLEDVEQALQEMLFRGGSLNLKLLGADRVGFGQVQ